MMSHWWYVILAYGVTFFGMSILLMHLGTLNRSVRKRYQFFLARSEVLNTQEASELEE